MTFRFEFPWALLLLAPVLVILLLNVLGHRRRASGLLFPSMALLSGIGSSWRGRLRWITIPIRLVAVVLVVLAIARPQAGEASLEVIAEGIDIVLVMDTSFSMEEQDFGGNSRIDASKKVAQEFLEGLKSHRVGVVLFSGEAIALAPLTLDYSAVGELIETVEAGVLTGGTAIGMGMSNGINLLRKSEARSKVMILLTDGQNNSGAIGPYDAAELAKLMDVRVYTIGAVGESESGRRGLSPIDERQMRRVSELTGGAYYSASDAGTLLAVYEEIEQLEISRIGARNFIEYEEANIYFLAPALALLVLELLLGATILRRAP